LAAVLALLCLAVLSVPAALAVGPDETDARKIMEAVRDRPEADTMQSVMRMKIEDNTGSSRERTIQLKARNFGDVTKQIVFFKAPPQVRNTGLLTWDYEKSSQADDQWLYLPRMKKLQRIAASDKSGAFMGSDFSYSDMTSPALEDFDYRLVKQSATVSKEDCWLIETTPRTKKAQEETGYARSYLWISKSKLMPLQIKAQLRAGQRVKYIKFGAFKQVGGIWIAHRVRARTKRGKVIQSTTWLSLENVRVNDGPMPEGEFTTSRLERGL
jgi:outer membrane lipoprotein-sorting protein